MQNYFKSSKKYYNIRRIHLDLSELIHIFSKISHL